MGKCKSDYDFIDEIQYDFRMKVKEGLIGTDEKIVFVCDIHGEYIQSLSVHSRGNGCPQCGYKKRGMALRKTDYPFMNEITPEWQAKIKSGECNSLDKVEFECNKGHENYWQTLGAHSSGQGCPLCGRIGTRRKDYPFMDEIVPMWQEKIRNGECIPTTKVEFKCLAELGHPNYMQTLNRHDQGTGCPECGKIAVKRTDFYFMDEITLEWQDKIKNGECNTYSNVEFICCKGHSNYFQTLSNHLQGHGCPECARKFKQSRGEQYVNEYLSNYNIPYNREITFMDCRYKNPLRFDFGIMGLDDEVLGIIEVDGRQHVVDVGWWDLDGIQERDAIKTNYCQKNNIPLLRLEYNHLNPSTIRKWDNLLSNFILSLHAK